jgi:hypothetical protein
VVEFFNPSKPIGYSIYHRVEHSEILPAAHTVYLFIFCVLLTQYCAGGKIEKNEMGRACGAYGGGERVLVEKPEGKRPLGIPRRRWEDNIKMNLQEVRGGCGDWMERDQDRGYVVGTCEYGNELSGSIKCGEFLD